MAMKTQWRIQRYKDGWRWERGEFSPGVSRFVVLSVKERITLPNPATAVTDSPQGQT